MKTVLLVFIGGGIGSICRYWLNLLVRNHTDQTFPYGIMAVNLLGSFLIGFVAMALRKHGEFLGLSQETTVMFVMVGLLGGFTTFSAVALDTANMLLEGRLVHAAFYIIFCVVVSVLAAFIGMAAARLVF